MTDVGAEGLSVGEGIVRAPEEAAGFAARVVEAFRDPGAARERASAGRRDVLVHHAWDAIAPLQAAAWDQAMEHGR